MTRPSVLVQTQSASVTVTRCMLQSFHLGCARFRGLDAWVERSSQVASAAVAPLSLCAASQRLVGDGIATPPPPGPCLISERIQAMD